MAKKKGPPKEPSRRHGIHRFEEVLSAAEALISEGTALDEITLQMVAARANVPRVSLYYFFPSVDALIEALYHRVLSRMMNEMGNLQLKPTADWKRVISKLMDTVVTHYSRNRLTIVLALMPNSMTMINQAHLAYGAGLAQLLVSVCGFKPSAKLSRSCSIAAEIATTVYRKSFIEEGRITSAFDTEARNAAIAYLATALRR
ncbi:MAG: TetR family transcriptional regulator [Gammaproteobacteria bacterium]